MRIGIFSQWYEPEPAPIPPVLARELQRRKHSVLVLTGFPNYPEGHLYDGYRMALRRDEVVSGIPVRRVALFPSHGPSALGRLANYGSFAISASLWAGWFKQVEGLWVSNSPPTVGIPTLLVKSRYRPRVVLHIMDLWPESLMASGFGGPIRRWPVLESALDKWLSMTYDVADSIACTSRAQIELLAHRGVARDKLSYVPTWVDESIFHPLHRDEALAESLGVRDKITLLYAGAIGEPQGLDFLIEACDRLQQEPRFHCIIAGSGSSESRLRQQVIDKGLRNITFLGRWPITDMTRLMSVGDIHLVSLRADRLAEVAMPSKIPAILACGKPIIVAARGEAASAVTRSLSGWTCSPGDPYELESAIRQALASDQRGLTEIGKRAREAYEQEFAVDIAVDRVEQLLAGGLVGARHVA